MVTRRTRTSKSVTLQAAEMALAVPSVVAHRVTRMALSGPMPSARDRREFHRMGAEKVEALQESLAAMATETVIAHQRLAMSMVQSLLAPWTALPHPAATVPHQWHHSALGVLEKGLAPVHRRAVANARRLRNTPLR